MSNLYYTVSDEAEELRAEVERLREALHAALDAMRRNADDHACDYCRADIASVERAMENT